MVGEEVAAAAEAATRVDAAGNENSILHKTTALTFYSALKWWLLEILIFPLRVNKSPIL